jgi:hypothetical protein
VWILFASSSSLAWASDDPVTQASSPTAASSSGSSLSASQTAPEDAATLQLAEPEYRLINVPTTMLLPRNKMSFDLTHRFAGNLRGRSFGDNFGSLFGIDEGATIGIELRYGLLPGVQVAFYRTSFSRTIQLHGKWDAIRQSGPSPVSVSALLSIEATDNFQDDKSPAIGATVSRTISDVAALYAEPIYVHNVVPLIGETRDSFAMGIGGRLRIRPTVYVTAEITPRLAGYEVGEPEWGFSIEKRAGGHMFQLNFTNTFSTTYAQVSRGGFPDSLYLGFNLARKFF